MKKSQRMFGSLCLAGAMVAPTLGLGSQVFAAEEAAAPAAAEEGPKISGVFGADYNTHFISWGYDTWSAGNDFGGEGTFNPYAEIKIDFDSFFVKVGTWWDVNTNVDSALGGQIQEVDVYYGVFVPVGKFTFGFVYQDWVYGGTVETVFDLSVSFDDSDLLGKFKMSPSFTAHALSSHGEIGGGTVKDSGWAFQLAVAPGFTLMESKSFDVAVSFPITVTFGDDEFYGSSQDDFTFAYFTVGVSVSIPLKFIPAKYGAWSVGMGLTYYVMNEAAIPTDGTGPNVDGDFLGGKIGFSVGF